MGNQPGDRTKEGITVFNYLLQQGVPEDAILVEVDARSTWEAMSASRLIMSERHLERALLVSDPYHAARIKGMASELGLDAYVSSTRTSPVTGFGAFRHMLKEAAGVAAARVVGWDRLTNWTE